MEHTKPYIDRTLRVFISYSTKNKLLAGKFKTALARYGFDTFIAHDDLEFGAEWEKQIIHELKICDVFIPLLSSDFKESDWAPQEVGIAIQLEKKILPLNAGMNPYGFIHGIQAIRISEDNVDHVIEEVINHLRNDGTYGNDLTDTMVRGLVTSNDFDSANMRARLLRYENLLFNSNQANEIVRGYLTNNQIRGGYNSEPIIRRLILDNRDKIELGLFREFESMIE